jgi:AraC-like DNA-binding protein
MPSDHEVMKELLLFGKAGPSEMIIRAILLLERLSRCPYRKLLDRSPHEDSPASDYDIQLLSTILEYVSIYSVEVISLQRISSDMNMSIPTFTRFFRRMVGCSFVAYLMKWRLDRARILLRNCDDSILSIAYKVGFNNLAHFNRQYKRHFGHTPHESK